MADLASVYTNEKGLLGGCSSVQAMSNQTVTNDSKGESFPLDFNLKDVTYTIEVEIKEFTPQCHASRSGKKKYCSCME